MPFINRQKLTAPPSINNEALACSGMPAAYLLASGRAAVISHRFSSQFAVWL